MRAALGQSERVLDDPASSIAFRRSMAFQGRLLVILALFPCNNIGED